MTGKRRKSQKNKKSRLFEAFLRRERLRRSEFYFPDVYDCNWCGKLRQIAKRGQDLCQHCGKYMKENLYVWRCGGPFPNEDLLFSRTDEDLWVCEKCEYNEPRWDWCQMQCRCPKCREFMIFKSKIPMERW